MHQRLFAVFVVGIVTGVACTITWLLFAYEYGSWKGAAASFGVLAGFWIVIINPILKITLRYYSEAIGLFLWATKGTVEHLDYSAPNDTYRGSALAFVLAYRKEWHESEIVNVLRDLKGKGNALARNPDTGKNFSVWIVKEQHQEHDRKRC